MQKSPESAQGTKAPNHSGTNKSGCNCRKQVLWALISSSSALHYEAEFVLASHACHSSHTGILGCCLSLRIPSHFYLRKKKTEPSGLGGGPWAPHFQGLSSHFSGSPMPSIASASPQRSPGKSQPHGPQVSGDGQGKKRCLPFTKGPQSIQSCDSWWGAFWDASFVPFSTKNYAHGMKNEGSWNCHLRIGTSCGNCECIVWLFDIWCHVLFCLFVLVFFEELKSQIKLHHHPKTTSTHPSEPPNASFASCLCMCLLQPWLQSTLRSADSSWIRKKWGKTGKLAWNPVPPTCWQLMCSIAKWRVISVALRAQASCNHKRPTPYIDFHQTITNHHWL